MPEANGPSSNDSNTSASLIRGIQSRNQLAWVAFVDRYGPLVVRWCRKYQLRDEDIEDVFQSVLEAVSAGIGGFNYQNEGSMFRKWLWTITRNKLADFWRNSDPRAIGGSAFQSQINAVTQDEPDTWSDANGHPMFHRYAAEIEAVRAAVNPASWRAFWETTIEERQAVHVAEDLDMTVGAVWAAKCRILKMLRAAIGDGKV